MKVTIYWVTNNLRKREEIRRFFNIPRFTSINGETTITITDELLKVLRKGEPGFIKIRRIVNDERE